MLTTSIARSSGITQWVCNSYLSPYTINAHIFLCSIAPSITSLACTRVILALRGLLLHSGTESPPPYASGTLPSYHDPSDDRNEYLGGSRRRDHRNRSLDFFVSAAEETIGQSTSAGAYEFTTFGGTTSGTEVGSSVGFTGLPPDTKPIPGERL